MNRLSIYENYIEAIPKLRKAAQKFMTGRIPDSTFSFSVFLDCWDQGHPILKVARSGTDFCDLHTKVGICFHVIEETDERNEVLSELLTSHLDHSIKKHNNYRNCLLSKSGLKYGSVQQILFDFAEKVFPPRLSNPPVHLCFVICFNFDFFGAQDSNLERLYIYGLSKGPFSEERPANTVISILHHTIVIQIVPTLDDQNIKKLCL